MKKRILITIASITLISGVTAGALMNQPKEETKQDAKVTNVNTPVEKTIEAPKEQEIVETPEANTPLSDTTIKTEVATEPIKEYTLEDARLYFLSNHSSMSIEVFDNYFTSRPWVIEQQKQLGGWSDGYIDHLANGIFKYEQARIDARR